MRKIIRALGIAFLCVSFPIVLGSVGLADLEIITLTQALQQCLIGFVIGIVGFVFMCITEHAPNNTEGTSTPINPYSKCCNCPHYVDCCKNYSELLQCKGGETI